MSEPILNKRMSGEINKQVYTPDFSKIVEKPKNKNYKRKLLLALKIFLGLVIILIIGVAALGLIYYNNLKQVYSLSFGAKANLETAVHKLINREFKESADLISQANGQFTQAQQLFNEIIIIRQVPYLATQIKAVDRILEVGIKLTDSGQKVTLLIDDIVAPLKNESINYASISAEQKREILKKIVDSENLLYEVQQQIDEADSAIEAIPEEKLVKPLRDGLVPLKQNLPRLKLLIDHSLPMLRVIPKIVGFDQPKSYLFLLQNNSELRPTGGFIGTYGILKLQDGEIKQFQTDNVYNLDRATQHVLKIQSPWQIEKYLEQKDWSLRDINWAPDFPTTAQKAMYIYKEENRVLQELKESGQLIKGEGGETVTDNLPYEDVDGVIAVTPEIIEQVLKLTGPIAVNGVMFTDENLKDQLEFMVGMQYRQLGIPMTERKEIIRKLADEIKAKLFSLPLQRVTDLLEIAFKSLAQKQVLIYVTDAELEKLVLERGWGGEIKDVDSDYLMVVDSNLGSLKTDQYMKRTIDYSANWQGNDLIANVVLTYQNNADFTWKSTRLRNYVRIYVPLGSELIEAKGAMENDKVRDPAKRPGQVEVADEFKKTFFGAFISIEPNETGVLSFKYKLPVKIKDKIKQGSYDLLVQKQAGVIPDLTLSLNFGKNIKLAEPDGAAAGWFSNEYKFSNPLDEDKAFSLTFK